MTLTLLSTPVGGQRQPTLPAAATVSPSENYELDENWAELPDGVEFGAVSWVAIDAHGSVHAFRREGPILNFDDQGKLLRSWGEGIAYGLTASGSTTKATSRRPMGKAHQVKKFNRDGRLLMML